MPHNTPDKPTLRRQARERLAQMTDAERAAASAAISAALLPHLATHARVLTYLPMPGEVDVSAAAVEFLSRGITLAAPRLDWDASTMHATPINTWPPPIELRHHNVPEPPEGHVISPGQIDAAIVPALAFDTTGARLGRGGGFYDRYLAQLPPTTRLIGVCFELQVLERVPVDKHDVRMHQVVCEHGPIMPESPR